MDLYIDNRQAQELPEEISEIIERIVLETLEYENRDKRCEVSVSIVNNAEIQALNKQYRGIDSPTDVLSFPLEDLNCLGDIVISFPKAVEQAEEYGHGIKREIGFLTAHSMLHLLGYDHIIEEDEKVMFAKQEEILKIAGLPRLVAKEEHFCCSPMQPRLGGRL